MTTYTNTLWRLFEPDETTYARSGMLSQPRLLNTPECARCARGALYEEFPKPMILVWEPDSEVVGDFSFTGGRAAVKRTVFDTLAGVFDGIVAERLEMEQDPKLKRPKRPTKRTKPRVWLPYEGPPLVEMWIDRMAPYLSSTTLVVPYHCDDCGRAMTKLGGTERIERHWSEEMMGTVPCRIPRVPGQGVFVRDADLGGVKIFRVEEFSRMILCTNEVKAFIEERGFTNVDFLEYGNVVA